LRSSEFLVDFQLQFAKARDGRFFRHPGAHQPPNHFCQIDGVDRPDFSSRVV